VVCEDPETTSSSLRTASAYNGFLAMNQESFEAKILQLWMTTRVPFSRANLQFATGAPRKKMEAWLRQLVIDGVLDADVDDAGEMIYSVRGAERPRAGAASPAELDKMERLTREARAASATATGAMALARLRDVTSGGPLVAGSSQKSLVASGLLSFFFGPIGWLYAGHWKEALPAAGVLILLKFILPTFLLLPLLGVVGPVSAGIGVLYAWMYNRKGERTKILPALPEGKE
jgi:hypothetical protein